VLHIGLSFGVLEDCLLTLFQLCSNCSPKNVLMDAIRMFPQGFHPVEDIFLHDLMTPAPTTPRLDAGVKYHFVDYGISSYFPADSQPQPVLGDAGSDQDVPELSDTEPYDPFKVDIFSIGNVLRREFRNVGFRSPVAHTIVSFLFLCRITPI
jgi:hypothetical protein